jgi:1-acyl-sn-glycerol-3-phosphate acyltransferase
MVSFTPRFLPFWAVYQLVMIGVRVLTSVLFAIEIRGRENLRSVPRAILVSNHSLVLDPALIARAIRPRRTYFTMLEETALIPLLGTFVRLLGGIPLPGGARAGIRRERGIDDALKHLGLVHFFPEGECYLCNQQIMPFYRGAFHAACQRGLPVLPVTTVLRQRAWGLWGRLGLPPRASVFIGEPLVPDRDDSPRVAEESLARRIREQMQAVIDREGGCKSMSRGAMPRLALHAVNPRS